MLGFDVLGDVLIEIKNKGIVEIVDNYILKFAELHNETNAEVLQRLTGGY